MGNSGSVYFGLSFLILRISGFSPFFRNPRSVWFLYCLASRFGGQPFTLLNYPTSDLFLLPAHTTVHPFNHPTTSQPHHTTFHRRPHTRPSGGHGWRSTPTDLKHVEDRQARIRVPREGGGEKDHTHSGATGGGGQQPCLERKFPYLFS